MIDNHPTEPASGPGRMEFDLGLHHTLRVSGERRRNTAFLVLIISLLVYPAVIALAAKNTNTAAEEIKIGTEEANKFAADKTTKFVTDPALQARIDTIGQAIAKVANEKVVAAGYGKPDVYKFKYTFKIVDDKDINAFSLPGGFVYINKALIDYVQSDDELAGVMAHEIAHIAHHHVMQLLAEQNKQTALLAGMIAAAGLGGVKPQGLFGILGAGGLISLAKTSGYGQKAELDADRTGVVFLADTKKYNPVGMLTFMERLARDELRKPGVNYGIFMNHPPSNLRAREIIDEIQKLGLPINRRMVTSYTQVQVKPVDKSSASSVWISDTEIIRLADSGGLKAKKRAESTASELRNALLSGARYHDVKLSDDGKSVMILGDPVILPSREDALLAGTSISDLASAAAAHIKEALVKELLNDGY